MAVHTFALTPARIGKYKADILKHAMPQECLSRQGRQVQMPAHASDTYVARRFVPFNATAASPNVFFPTANGDRGNVIVQAALATEGVTPPPDSIVPQDLTVIVQQYTILYGFTDKTYNLYEDDIPKEMIKQVGERVTLINELVMWGVLRGSTNQFFGGVGTTIATVNGGLTLGFIRKIAKSLQANHAKPVNSMLKASGDYDTSAVEQGYAVYCHTDLEPDIRDLPGFVPSAKYASGKPEQYEIGTVERMRFFTSPDLPSLQNAGAAVGATGLFSTSAVNIDVYQLVVVGQDAWSQIAVRGLNALDPTYLAPGEKTKSDPLGQRGYAGTIWWKAGLVENSGWMAVGNVGAKVLA